VVGFSEASRNVQLAERLRILEAADGVCRKKKAVHKATSTDDKRLQTTLKRLGVNTIPGIEVGFRV